METLTAYLPIDRLQSIITGQPLSEQAEGTVLFADISGYTSLVDKLETDLGRTTGVDIMTCHINQIFSALIVEVHQQQGCVVSFGGDALTCWFAADDGLRAVTCALAMQKAMDQFTCIEIPPLELITLTLKISIASGSVRRLEVGDPMIQVLDVLTGEAMLRLAEMQPYAKAGSVIVDVEIISKIDIHVVGLEWRTNLETRQRYAIVAGLVDGARREPVLLNKPYSTNIIENLEPTSVRPWLLRPVYERLVRGQGSFLAEIRPIVVLFLRFAGLNYSMDDEAGKKLSEYIQSVQHILAQYKGFLIKLTIDDKGSYLLAAFGAPITEDDATNSALTAALALCTSVTLYPFINDIRIGLSQGRMLAGAFGSPARAAYDLLGNHATVANRLMMRAEPGQILVTETVVKNAGAHYQFDAPRLERLKGLPYSLLVYRLLEETLPSAPKFLTRLVGRERQLVRMRELRDQALMEQGNLCRIEGVAGVGKSHLVAEFIAQSQRAGFAIATGTCEITRQTTPYYAWQQLIRALLGVTQQTEMENHKSAASTNLVAHIEAIVTAINPDWQVRLPLLSEVLNLSIADNPTTAAYDPPARQAALVTMIGDLIRVQANQQPLLLVLDDIQWQDEASLQLTLAVCRIIADLRVIFILVQRPFDVAQDSQLLLQELALLSNYHVLPLSELAPGSIRRLVNERLAGNSSPLLLSVLQRQAQGNPFYTEELITELSELERLCFDANRQQWTLVEATIESLRKANCLTIDPANGDWVLAPDASLSNVDLGTPDTLHALVLARIDRLTDEYILTLKTASVIGRSFEADILALARPGAPLELAVLQHHLALLTQRNFIDHDRVAHDNAHMFKHHIIQEVLYNALLQEQQRQLHLAVGAALEKLQTRSVERLAYHYSRSQDRKKAPFYLDKAARKAQHDHANQTAMNYYQQALLFGERWEWRKGMVEVLHVLGQLDGEREQLEKLSSLRGVPEFDLAYLWGQYYEAINDYAQAEGEIERAWETVQNRGELILEVRCLNKLGWIAWKNGGNYAQAELHYRQAIDLLDGWAHYDGEEAHALIDTLNSLGTLYRQQGDWTQAEARYQQALEMSRQSKNRREEARTLDNLGSLAYHQRQFDQALTHHQAALRLFRMIGDRSGAGDALHNLVLVFQERGEYRTTLENLAAVEEIRRSTGNRWEIVNVCMEFGILYHELGDLAQAEAHLQRGLQVAQQINDLEGRAYLLSNLGLVLRDQANWEAAIIALTDGLAYMESKNNQVQIAFFCSYRATVYLAMGEWLHALEDARQAIAIRQRLGLYVRTADDLATVALLSLAKGEFAQALEAGQQVWAILLQCGGEGPESPPRAYFVCFQVFQAAGLLELAQAAMD